MGFWSKVGIGGLIGAAVVALPVAAMSIRNSRRTNDDDIPTSPQLSGPLPQVLEYMPPAPPQPQTLMGEPIKEGDFAKRYKNQCAGGERDVSSPNIVLANGRNAIDGTNGVQELNAPTFGRAI